MAVDGVLLHSTSCDSSRLFDRQPEDCPPSVLSDLYQADNNNVVVPAERASAGGLLEYGFSHALFCGGSITYRFQGCPLKWRTMVVFVAKMAILLVNLRCV